jgi:hypothetical protein
MEKKEAQTRPEPKAEAEHVAMAEDPDWSGGTLSSSINAPLKRTFGAARLALAEMGLAIDQQQLQAPTATLAASLGGGEELNIGLKQVTHDATHARIRVGFTGDEKMSREVLKHIQNNL